MASLRPYNGEETKSEGPFKGLQTRFLLLEHGPMWPLATLDHAGLSGLWPLRPGLGREMNKSKVR